MIPIAHSEIVNLPFIKIHFISYSTQKPNLLLMHGLTANAYAFQGLMQAGLTEKYNVISIDFRGRGKSQQPTIGYTIKEHAHDVIGLLDYLKIDEISLCGHSFGGLMASFLAYHFPKRFNKITILDAAPQMNPRVAEMLGPALSRIDRKFPSFDHYLETIKTAPYMEFWDDAMLPYYRADVETYADGSVESIADLTHIIQISTFVGLEPWSVYFHNLKQPSKLIVGSSAYTLGEPLLPSPLAQKTFNKMKNASYHEVEGNHHTMLYGKGAQQIVDIL